MPDAVSAALKIGKRKFQTNDHTVWLVTFVTNTTLKGQVTFIDGTTYSIRGDSWLYFFDAQSVVHLSPVLEKGALRRAYQEQRKTA